MQPHSCTSVLTLLGRAGMAAIWSISGARQHQARDGKITLFWHGTRRCHSDDGVLNGSPVSHAANCALGVDREISSSSGVMSAGTLANSGVLR